MSLPNKQRISRCKSTKAPDGCLCFMNLMSESRLPSQTRRIVVPSFDPQTQPVVPSMALPPLMDTSITLDFICKAFASQVDWQVEPVFSHSFHTDDMPIQKGGTQAPVCLPLVQRPEGLPVLFNRHAST